MKDSKKNFDLNKVEITGTVNRIIGETEKFISFSLASAQDAKVTNYITIKAFSSQIAHPEKGDTVKVVGHISSGSYKKGKDTIYETYVTAEDISEVE